MNEETVLDILPDPGDGLEAPLDSTPVDAAAPSEEITDEAPAEKPAQSLEVISVDELLERLTAGEEASMGGDESVAAAEEATVEEVPEESAAEPEPLEVAGTDETLTLLETLHQDLTHPFLTTSFEDYTVTEGLLLLILLWAFISWCIKMLKEGFSWL